MTITEVRDWVKGVDVAGQKLAFVELARDDHSVRLALTPTPEQLLDLKIGVPLRSKRGDPKNVLIRSDGQIILMVFTH